MKTISFSPITNDFFVIVKSITKKMSIDSPGKQFEIKTDKETYTAELHDCWDFTLSGLGDSFCKIMTGLDSLQLLRKLEQEEEKEVKLIGFFLFKKL